MKTDIQIAQEAEMLHIREVAAKVGIPMELWKMIWNFTASIRQNYRMN